MFYNTRHTLYHVFNCIKQSKFNEAEEFLTSIIEHQSDINSINDESISACTELIETLFEKNEDVQAGNFIKRVLAIDGSKDKHTKHKLISTLSNKKYYLKLADNADKFFHEENYFEALRRYEICIALKNDQESFIHKKLKCEELLKARDNGESKPQIKVFKSNRKAGILGQEIEIIWSVSNAKNLSIIEYPGNREWKFFKLQGNLKIDLLQSNVDIIQYTLTVENFHNITNEEKILVRIFPTPLFRNIDIPFPALQLTTNLGEIQIGSPIIEIPVNIPNNKISFPNSLLKLLQQKALLINHFENLSIFKVYESIRNRYFKF